MTVVRTMLSGARESLAHDLAMPIVCQSHLYKNGV